MDLYCLVRDNHSIGDKMNEEYSNDKNWSNKHIILTDLEPGEAMNKAGRWIARNASEETTIMGAEMTICSVGWMVTIHYMVYQHS